MPPERRQFFVAQLVHFVLAKKTPTLGRLVLAFSLQLQLTGMQNDIIGLTGAVNDLQA